MSHKLLIIIKFLLIVFAGTACNGLVSPPFDGENGKTPLIKITPTLASVDALTPSLETQQEKQTIQTGITTTPTTSLLTTCQTDNDCVLSIQVDVCCSCPEVTTRAYVQATNGVEVYVLGNNYGLLRPMECAQVDCAECPLPPAGAICRSNVCRAPKTVQEILTACPDCFAQAAQTAYQSGHLQEAVDFCTQTTSTQQHTCFSELLDTALTNNRLDEAEQLCRQHPSQDLGSCLPSIALQWASSDDQQALALCNELDPADARHFVCVLDVALVVQPQNENRALEICAQLPVDEAELCRQEISDK